MPTNFEQGPDVKLDRLFVPLSTEPYQWFEQGRKKWELRIHGANFTEDHVYFNRHVELRKGYSSNESIWGRIEYVIIEANIKNILTDIPFYEVIPEANCRSEAITIIQDILNPAERDDLIAFKIDPEIEHIELDPLYFDDVLNRDKTSTIRLGHRNYNEGPAIFHQGTDILPIHIEELQYTTRDKLDTESAIQDGFSNLSELQTRLNKHYPEMEQDDPVTIVKFRPAISN